MNAGLQGAGRAGGWERYAESIADAVDVFAQVDAPAVDVGDFLGDGEAEAAAFGAAGPEPPVEALEDALAFFRGNARTVVADRHRRFRCRRDAHGHASALSAVADRVVY